MLQLKPARNTMAVCCSPRCGIAGNQCCRPGPEANTTCSPNESTRSVSLSESTDWNQLDWKTGALAVALTSQARLLAHRRPVLSNTCIRQYSVIFAVVCSRMTHSTLCPSKRMGQQQVWRPNALAERGNLRNWIFGILSGAAGVSGAFTL